MIETIKVDAGNKGQVKEFIDFHYDLYQGTPQWVPPFYSDMHLVFDKKKHPFYEINSAEFFTAKRDGKVVARIVATENTVFNEYHHTRKGTILLFRFN